MANTGSSNLLKECIDDVYFSILFDEEEMENFSVSNEKYAEELQLQEVLESSVIFQQMTKQEENSSRTKTKSSTIEGGLKKKRKVIEKETGEPSQYFCEICMDGKPTNEMFKNKTCSHMYCTDCTRKYVSTKIEENINMVRCPEVNCEGVIEIDHCRSFIAEDVFDRWAMVLCETLLVGFVKLYCPYKDCSEMLVDEGGEVVRESECPICRRLFCAQCKVPWHSGIECGEFQMLNEDERKKEDIMVVELAKKEKWRRCPLCKFFVEKGEGCLHITCRCGFQFCYRCGCEWSQTHHGCPEVQGPE